jgi:hypothetical protein
MRHRYYFLGGLAAGYVLGAAAGRERYEQIKRFAQQVSGNPRVQQAATDLQENAAHLLESAKDKVADKMAERDLPSWIPGRRNDQVEASGGPGPVPADPKQEDAWANATKSQGPVH